MKYISNANKPKTVEIRFTKEELRKYEESYEVDEHTKMAIQALEEVQQYREIGTLEECRTAREKQIPMKPDASIKSGIGENMENRYLSKAKRISDGEWVVWNIFSGLYGVDIDKSTICQCTGLKDKNGKLIWENDIINNKCGKAVVVCDKAGWQIEWIKDIIWRKDLYFWVNERQCEVIGNKIDNPELLESEVGNDK